MDKMIARFLSIIMFTPIFLLDIPANEIAATSLSTVGQTPSSCVKAPLAQSYGGTSRYALRFTNFCPDRVYINVCVKYDDGSAKLYNSGSRIKPAGFMEIYTEPFKRPVDLKVAFGPFMVGVPPPCSAPG